MKLHQIDTTLTVTAQIAVDDMTSIAGSGFQTIICNRPDGETPDQVAFADIHAAAEAAGMKAHYLPAVT